jgi:nucleotidyltransferase-like protein
VNLNRPLSTVTPTLDGDVLAVLARVDAGFTAGQLRRILTRYSEEGIRKVLHRLAEQGVVRTENAGNAVVYRFNSDHLAAEHIVGLAGLRETFLARLEQRLGAWEVPPVYAAVFGSAARGTMTAGSDVDLLLVRPDEVDGDRWESQVALLVADVSRWTGNDTRPLEFTAAELADRAGEEPVLRDVLEIGLTVAGTRSWLAKQLWKSKG